MESIPTTATHSALNQELNNLMLVPKPSEATWNQEISYISLSMGVLYGSQSARHLISARTHALHCLMTDPGFASLYRSNGSHLSFRVLMALDDSPQTVQCATLAVVAWAKWLHSREAGVSSVNHESITALAEWVWRRRGKVGDLWAGYALGLAHSLQSKWQGGNMKRAEVGFKSSLKMKTQNPIWILDLVEYSLVPMKKQDEIKKYLRKLHEMDAQLNEASKTRLNQLMRREGFSFDDE